MLAVLLVLGCATPSHKPSRPAATANPARDVQFRLLQDARSLDEQGQPQAAARLLERWLQTYPDSPLVAEARWRLARTYEQGGNLPAALTQYRQVARLAWESEQGRAARVKIAELERTLQAQAPRHDERTVVFLATERLPLGLNFGGWLAGLARAGVTGLGVTAGMEADVLAPPGGDRDAAQTAPGAGVYFQTDWAPTTRDIMGQLVPAAHRHGLAVYVSVNLRRMDWVDPKLGWQDRWYDPVDRQMKPAAALDLFHPSYQEYLIGLLTDLAVTGVDGVLFRAAPPLRAGEALSAFALEAFQKDFGVALDPGAFFPSSGARGAAGAEAPPEVWRWYGWRSREVLKVMDRLRQAMRKRAPALRVGLEFHAAAATDPVRGLALYQEDLLEAKRWQWDFYVVRRDPAAPRAPAETGTEAGSEQTGLAIRTAALLDNGGKIWLGMPLWTKDPARLSERLALAMDHAAFPSGVGLWYVAEPAAVP